MNKYVKIKGMGYATAQRRVNNTDFTWLDTSDEWITSRTGINSRYVTETENTSDLALRAAVSAIEDAGIDKRDIDTIIVATFTPDMLTPSVASILQAKLGLNDCPIMAFDLNSACTGFVMAFQTVSAFIQTGRTKTALIVGAETLSKVMDWKDRGTCVLFGDGAGAFICTNQGVQQVESHFANSRGDLEDVLSAEGLKLQDIADAQPLTSGTLKMQGQAVFRFAVDAISDGIRQVIETSGLSLDQIDYIIPHQANLRIIAHVASKMKIPQEKFITNLERFGNTSAASIPIAMAEAKANGILKEGQRIIMVGFGAGLTWAGSTVEL